MTIMRWLRLALLLGASLGLAGPGVAQTKGLVDDQRLLNASDKTDADWITFGQDYKNQRFSSLTEINRQTVGKLSLAWIYQTGIVGSTQTEPLIVDGVMYFTTPSCDVIAVNAATGEEVWRYRHKFTSPRAASNRGAAVGYGKVFEVTDDHRVIALDQATGKVVWDKSITNFQPPSTLGQPGQPIPDTVSYSLRNPPLVYNGMLIAGATQFSNIPERDAVDENYINAKVAAGHDVGLDWIQENLGRRGFLFALDASTGNEMWRWYTTKEDGWEGGYAETAADGTPLNRDIKTEQALSETYKSAWAAASVGLHFTPSLDPALGLLFIGTANATQQFLPMARPGDNLYANSLVAVDAKTGKLRWYFQGVPHALNHDLITQTTLFDVNIDGRTVPAVGAGSKTGVYWVVERATGKFLFRSDAYVPQMNTFAPVTDKPMMVAPGDPGGSSVSPTSYDPTTGYVYLAAVNRPNIYSAITLPSVRGRPEIEFLKSVPVPLSEANGTLTALDLNNKGKIVWQVKTKEPLVGGTLATAGGLVFIGEANGHFNAYDSKTGQQLWTFQTGANVGASVVSYAVDGRQYVAVATGAAAPADGTPIAPGALRPGGAMMVFALPK
jgi:alcohol dehydrogenase (cytochrome c)